MASATNQILQLLDSQNPKIAVEGIRRAILLTAKGKDMAKVVPAVIKALALHSVEVKKLAFTFLSTYAGKQKETCLLAVNTFQKDLSSGNELIRAISVRSLSCIPLSILVPVIILSLQRAAQDTSPYVRYTVANSLVKLFQLDPGSKEVLFELLICLMDDSSPLVVSAAIRAFYLLSPQKLSALHSIYHKLLKMIFSFDDFTQALYLNIMTRYIRSYFTDPDKDSATSNDKDYLALLDAAIQLLHSRNAAVIVSAASLIFDIGTFAHIQKIIGPLIRLMNGKHETIFYTIMQMLRKTIRKYPDLFKHKHRDFYIRSTDSNSLMDFKLESMCLIMHEENENSIIDEFEEYINSFDLVLADKAVLALGTLNPKNEEIQKKIIESLFQLLEISFFKSSAALSLCNVAIQLRDSSARTDIVQMLLKYISKAGRNAMEKFINLLICIHEDLPPLVQLQSLHDICKYFQSFDEHAKIKVLTLGLKVLTSNQNNEHAPDIGKIFLYVIQMAKYDKSIHIRDFDRLIRKVLFETCQIPEEGPLLPVFHIELVQTLLKCKQTEALYSYLPEEEKNLSNSLYFYMKDHCAIAADLPSWATEKTDSNIRGTNDAIEKYASPMTTAGGSSNVTPFASPVLETNPARELYDELEDFLYSSADEETDEDTESEESIYEKNKD